MAGHRRKKKNSTGNDDGQSGKRRKKKSTSEANKRKKKTTDDVDDVVAVPVSRRTTRGSPIYDTSESQTENIPKALASHLTAGPGEKQWDRLINPGFCNIKEYEVNTLVPLKCDTSYDSTMNYDDMCRKVCHRDCAEEAGLISELDDTFLYCSQECKNKGDKYCNEELQNNTPKTYNNNNNNITIDNIYSHLVFYIYTHVIVNYAICNVIHIGMFIICVS